MTMEYLPILSFVIAMLGLLISLITLYFTFMRSPKVEVSIGPFIKIYHVTNDKGISTNLILPTTLFNRSNRSSVIKKVAIEIYSKVNADKRFFVHSNNYLELDFATSKWKSKDVSYAIPILGKSSTYKTIRFTWTADQLERLIFKEGKYELRFIYWLSTSKTPVLDVHELSISYEDEVKLGKYIEDRKTTNLSVVLDKEMELNKLLSIHESERLIG